MHFVSQHVDPFWKDYRIYKHKVPLLITLPIKKIIVVTPEYWMFTQANNYSKYDNHKNDYDYNVVAMIHHHHHHHHQASDNINNIPDHHCDNRKVIRESRINESSSSSSLCNDTQSILHCPGCNCECGYWKRKCLDVIGHYCVADLYSLNEKCVKIKRNII